MTVEFSNKLKNRLIKFQQDEIDGALIYKNIANRVKNKDDEKILLDFSKEEEAHAKMMEKYTKVELKPNKLKILLYNIISFIFGYTFTLKIIENNEEFTANEYEELLYEIPELESLLEDEKRHEEILMGMLDEERLQYVGAMVLGLNDALVELTGTIAGMTFALMNTRLVALTGIVTGISATLSMAASNYLAEHAEGNPNALKSSIYTGVAYLITVVLMVLPYLILPNSMYLYAFIIMLAIVILIIFVFNFYISVAKSQKFLNNFGTMAIISLSVAAISFVIGIVAKRVLGVEI